MLTHIGIALRKTVGIETSHLLNFCFGTSLGEVKGAGVAGFDSWAFLPALS